MPHILRLATIIAPLVVFVLIAPRSSQAAGWVDVSMPAVSGAYTDVSFYGDSGVIAVNNGTVLYTVDGGSTWSTTSSPTAMNSVVMLSTTKAIGVGGGGTIYRSTDSGATWSSVLSPTTETLQAVDRYSSMLFAVGQNGTVIRSTDGGDIWTDVSFGETRDFYDVNVYNGSTAWMVGETGMVYEWLSSSGWLRLDPSTSFNLYSVSAVGSTDVWIAGQGEFLAELNSSGLTWTQIIPSDRDLTSSFYGLTFTSSSEGYAARYSGCLWKTTDSGISWSSLAGTCDAVFTDIAIRSTGEMYAVGIEESDMTTKTFVAYDIAGPTVSAPSVGSPMVNVSTTVSMTATDDYGISSCILLVNSSSVGLMTASGSTYSLSYAFPAVGTATVAAQCTDNAGNITTSSGTSVSVQGSSGATSYAGELVKLACASDADVNDPCKAVYYVTSDGWRHAFPNEKVYFTWYSDFDDVITIDSSTMTSFALGKNVTYKPGITMVKFVTVNTVYAVSQGGVLQAVGSESIAASLYGSDWNTQDVDDISDAFYGNYSFGTAINTASDYDVDLALTGTTTIEENF